MLENKSLLNNLLDDSELDDVLGGVNKGKGGQKKHECGGRLIEEREYSNGGYPLYRCESCGMTGKIFPTPRPNFYRIVTFKK